MTTKYFKATALIRKEVVISVSAEDEQTARLKAIEAIKNQNPSFNVSFQEINLEYETEYKVGCKIKHFLFGKGEIIDLTPTTNCNNDRCFSATIHFSNGDTKSIGLPMPREKFEILE